MYTPKETNKKITLKTNTFLLVSDADVVESEVENSFSTNSFYDFYVNYAPFLKENKRNF